MVCEYNNKTKFRKQLDFICSTDWADLTSEWKWPRKRKITSKKEKSIASKDSKNKSKQRYLDPKPKKVNCLKIYESKSAGNKRAAQQHLTFDVPVKEAVKCKVVNFSGNGASQFCVLSELRTQSVPNVNNQEHWDLQSTPEPASLTSRSEKSVASTINLDSGYNQNVFHKEQLVLQLHIRSASLIKYLFTMTDKTRTRELCADNISLPIRRSPYDVSRDNRIKHTIVEPKNPSLFHHNGAYVGSLIPNSSRPLGQALGYVNTTAALKITNKTLEVPELPSKFLLPPVSGHVTHHASRDEEIDKEGKSYMNSVSQLMGMLCIEPGNHQTLPQQSIQQWLDTS